MCLDQSDITLTYLPCQSLGPLIFICLCKTKKNVITVLILKLSTFHVVMSQPQAGGLRLFFLCINIAFSPPTPPPSNSRWTKTLLPCKFQSTSAVSMRMTTNTRPYTLTLGTTVFVSSHSCFPQIIKKF